MMSRKKESGFTLIELMIVIAVIGILAIVLIPKVGTIKTQAKASGIDTNVRMVQGYLQSRIDSWGNANDGTGTTRAIIAADLKSQLTSGTELITNPFSGEKTVIDANTDTWAPDVAVIINGSDVQNATTSVKGTIVVVPDATVSSTGKIKIYAHDSSGKTMADKTITVTP